MLSNAADTVIQDRVRTWQIDPVDLFWNMSKKLLNRSKSLIK